VSGPIRIDDVLDDRDLPIVHPDRTIGDSVELVPARERGQRGPLREIIRTRGRDEGAQLLTVAVVGSGVFESSLTATPSAARGPLVAVIEWGVRGARAKAEIDIPLGGVIFSLVASYIQVAARYDGLLLVNGVQLDPEATGGSNPAPKQRVAAMVGYGAYGPASRLTRTFRVDDIPKPGPPDELVAGAVAAAGIVAAVPDVPRRSGRIGVPAFARRVQILGLEIDAVAYRVRIGTFSLTATIDVLFVVGQPPRILDLPGDAAFVEVENLGPDVLVNPTFVFDVGL
jgi:hypothetical protein